MVVGKKDLGDGKRIEGIQKERRVREDQIEDGECKENKRVEEVLVIEKRNGKYLEFLIVNKLHDWSNEKQEKNRRKSRDAKGIKNQSDRNKCSQQTPKEWSCSINNESTRVNTLSCGLIRYKGSRASSDREQSSAPAACCWWWSWKRTALNTPRDTSWSGTEVPRASSRTANRY